MFFSEQFSLFFLDSVLYCLIIHEVPVLAMPLSYIPFTSESKILSYLKLKTKIPKSLMVLLQPSVRLSFTHFHGASFLLIMFCPNIYFV